MPSLSINLKCLMIKKQSGPVEFGHWPGWQGQVSGSLWVVCWFEQGALELRKNQQ